MSNRSRDPIGEAFGQSASSTPVRPLPLPTKSPAGEAIKSLVSFVLLAGLLVALGWMLAGRFGGGGGNDDRRQDDQHQQQQDDQKKKDQDQQSSVLPTGSWILLIEETADRSKFPYLATIQADKAWYDSVKAKGVEVGWYDIDASETKQWASEAKKIGLPALLVVDPSGKILKSVAAPTTTDAINSFVFGGGK